MRNRLKFIFITATFAAVSIIFSQFYWVYNNYAVTRSGYIRTAGYALQKSIENYQLTQNKLPTSLNYKAPTLTVFMRTIPDQDPIALDTPDTKRRFHAEFMTVAIDSGNLDLVRGLIARLQSQQKHNSVNIDSLSGIFHKTLSENGITDTFRLTVTPGKAVIPADEIAAVVSFYKTPVVVHAALSHPTAVLIRDNIIPAAISCLLILLSAGSLFYMWKTIQNQMKLNNMKNDFINNVTHELLTPVSILKTSNEAMISFGAADNPESLRRYLQTNVAVLDTMSANIERILDISRSESGMLLPVYREINLPGLIHSLTERLAVTTAAHIQLTNNLPVSFVVTDAFMVERIVENLLDNSIKYGGSSVEISVSSEQQNWLLAVADNGKGIPAHSLPFIFDKFYRVETGDLHEVKGYGLGLAYVKQLVTVLGGTITVKSHPGEFTVFTITIPYHE